MYAYGFWIVVTFVDGFHRCWYWFDRSPKISWGNREFSQKFPGIFLKVYLELSRVIGVYWNVRSLELFWNWNLQHRSLLRLRPRPQNNYIFDSFVNLLNQQLHRSQWCLFYPFKRILHSYTHAVRFTYIHTHHVYTFACMYPHTWTHIHKHVHTSTQIHIRIHAYIHACMHACMHTYIAHGYTAHGYTQA